MCVSIRSVMRKCATSRYSAASSQRVAHSSLLYPACCEVMSDMAESPENSRAARELKAESEKTESVKRPRMRRSDAEMLDVLTCVDGAREPVGAVALAVPFVSECIAVPRHGGVRD